MVDKQKSRKGVQSVGRAMDILELLGRLGPTGVTDIARQLDLHVARGHNLLRTLADGDPRVYLSGDTEFALDLARQVVRELKPAIAYPMHYGLFAENTADPQPFVEAVRQMDIAAETMTPGTAFSIE